MTALTAAVFLPLAIAHSQGPAELPTNADLPVLRDDARSLRLNPANLAFNQGLHVALDIANGLTGPESDLGGLGVDAAWGTGRGFGFGVASTWQTSPTPASTTWVGAAVGAPEASLGFSRAFWHGRDSPWAGRGSTALALSSRPSAHVGTLLQVRHLGRPRVEGVAIEREWHLGLAFRSTRGEVETELGITAEENALGKGALGTGVRLRPWSVLQIFSTATFGDPSADEAFARGDWEVAGGIEVSLGPTTAGAGLHQRTRGGDRSLLLVTSAEIHDPPRTRSPAGRGTMLRIDLSGGWSEQPTGGLFQRNQAGFTTMLSWLDRVARERGVDGVVLIIDGSGLGAAQAWELASALDAVRAAGKHVAVEWRSGTLTDLFLAAHADVVLVSPTTALYSSGISSTAVYLGTLLERVGITPQFERIAEWKTAPERLERSGPSEEERKQVQRWLDAVWEAMTERIALRRGVEVDAVRALLGDAPLTSLQLREARLVDDIAHPHEVRSRLETRLGTAIVALEPEEAWRERDPRWLPTRRVAVLHIDGVIAPGNSLPGGLLRGVVTGDTGVRRAARQIVADPSIEAVIVRVSSGGGSVQASDEIRVVIEQLSRTLPVVVSFGDVAASGGYYVAAVPGVRIVASPCTLTGSIGIFAGTLDVTPLLDRLGVHRERFEAGGRSTLFSGFAWTDEERSAVRRLIEAGYDRFIELVASARNMDEDAVRAVSGGRIHAGDAAREAGLVDDSSTGFLAALEIARDRMSARPRESLELVHFPGSSDSLLNSAVPSPFGVRDAQEEVERAGVVLGALGVVGALDAAWLMHHTAGAPMALLPWMVETAIR